MALQQKVEKAFAAVLAAAFADTVNIYTGKSAQTKASPSITCIADAGKEEPLDTGNFMLPVRIEVCFNPSGPETPEADSETLTTNVYNAIKTDTLAADLTSAIADFTCISVLESSLEFGPEEEVWKDTLTVNIYCCGVDL